MKRSEALRIIADQHAPGYDYDEMEAAEETLNALEKAGMLPPNCHKREDCECGNTSYSNYEWDEE